MAVPEFVRKLREKVGHSLLLLPGAGGVVLDARGRVLLQRERETGRWRIPGGVVDPGEQPADTVVREICEETGVTVVPERLVGVWAEPVIRYNNGDETSYVTLIFRCRATAGEPHVRDGESLEVRYFAPDELPEMKDLHHEWVRRALADKAAAYFVTT